MAAVPRQGSRAFPEHVHLAGVRRRVADADLHDGVGHRGGSLHRQEGAPPDVWRAAAARALRAAEVEALLFERLRDATS